MYLDFSPRPCVDSNIHEKIAGGPEYDSER